MDTADKIVQTAEALIQEHGYTGFSFQDVADKVGIKKGSLYYHFPSKAELGRAVVAGYRRRMEQSAAALADAGVEDYWQALARYLEPMTLFGRTAGEACLGGILSGEWRGLPAEMRSELRAFFDEHERWLTDFLEAGRNAGAFTFRGQSQLLARMLFSAVEGGLLIKRIKDDPGYFESILVAVADLLGRPSAA